jgi:hypothetical protein
MMDMIEPPPAPHPTSVSTTKSKNSKQKYSAITGSSMSVNMTASSNKKSDKKVKSEQKAVTLNNMQ